MNRWGIHAPNGGFKADGSFRRMDDFFAAGFENYTVLDGNAHLIPWIRERYPRARILVRAYLTKWNEHDPAEWTRQVVERVSPYLPLGIELTWANEQNLDIEGHPLGASPSNIFPPRELYEDINRWNLEMIRRLREALPGVRLHYPAFANGHNDDRDDGRGYVGLEICRPSMTLVDVIDCHCYWNVETGPLTLEGGQRFCLTHALYPDKPIFISECGNFAVEDPRTPAQYVEFVHSLYRYPYVEGAAFFIWDSDAAPENAPNVMMKNADLIRTLREVSKEPPVLEPPASLPQPPVTPPHELEEYIVQPGDTLYRIAQLFGVTIAALMSVNKIGDPRSLYAGQSLRIPEGGKRAEPAEPKPTERGKQAPSTKDEPTSPSPSPSLEESTVSPMAVYVVKPGDTLGKVARLFGVSVGAIAEANSLANPDLIKAGQRLVIPKPGPFLGAAQVAEVKGVGILGLGGARTKYKGDQSEFKDYLSDKRLAFYVTREGDTISRLGELFGVDADALAKINRLTADSLEPGIKLMIPLR